MRRALIAAVAIAGALTVAVPAIASADTSANTGRYSTFVHVSSYNQGLSAKLTVRTNRPMRVRIDTTVSCRTADFATDDSRDLPTVSRVVTPTRPFTRRYWPTFDGADVCDVYTSVSGGRGRLIATLVPTP